MVRLFASVEATSENNGTNREEAPVGYPFGNKGEGGRHLPKINTHFNLSPAEYEAIRRGHLHTRRRDLIDAELQRRQSDINSVLELGAGAGTLLAQLAAEHPDIAFRGVDVDSRMAEYAKTTYVFPNLEFFAGDITVVPPDSKFDLVYSIDVIHHLHRHLEQFGAVRNVLAPGGRWLAVEPNIWHPYVTFQQERMRRAGFDEDHLRPWRVEPLLRDSGLLVRSRTYMHFLPGGVTAPPRWLKGVERRLERWRWLGGSVVYLLVAG